MKIDAVFCKKCKEIVYSRCNKEYRSCSCGAVQIDTSIDYSRYMFKNIEDFIKIKLDGDVLLKQILYYDYMYQNKNANEWKEGYYGKFKLDKHSNPDFYVRLLGEYFHMLWKEV